MGPSHRKVRHHWEGVQQAEQLFGKRGRDAAVIHILRDCRHVPKREDYESGDVDKLGLVSNWPVTAYTNYPEEAFVALVNFALHGPTGKILWTFFRSQHDLVNFLSASTHLSLQEQQKIAASWSEVHARHEMLPPLELEEDILRQPKEEISQHLAQSINRQLLQALSAQFRNLHPAMVRTSALINPLVLIDLQYVEELRPSLEGSDDLSIAKFAMPDMLSVQMRAMTDPTMRRINVFSSHKGLTVSPIQAAQIPGVGLEIKFMITGTPELILVSRVANRLFLRSGIHRAYLLASLGHEEIPCFIVDEDAIPATVGVYPSFTPAVLSLPRPPLLMDALNPDLALDVPLVRTQKMISISAEELIFPSD